ncbi:MAG: hypothetical protein EA368_11735 [Leptolyngbya sp. DLM2.Bin27]|nr:MAG: hypothetical protein EA368_11735 [Leptolyngbya sp. DLM2.Bin27]
MALAGAGLLLLGGTVSRASAEALATCGSIDGAGLLDAACCPGDVLSNYWPMRSQQLSQTFCQLLMFPTATLANTDDFSDRIVDGSFSSDSRYASADTMTLPSLWWNRDSLTRHLGGRRLVQSWISYQIKDSATPVVDVLINPQMWSVLTYSERYAVLNQFGTAARSFGYNLRFFQGSTHSNRLVGLYACEFDAQPAAAGATATGYRCSANLDATRIVQIQRQLVAAGPRRQPPLAPTAQTTATDERI